MATVELTTIYEVSTDGKIPTYLADKEKVNLLRKYAGFHLYSTIQLNEDLPLEDLIFEHQYNELKNWEGFRELPLNERIKAIQERITEMTDGKITYD